MINIFYDMILCSCFSANFALICPNGIGFVMDRHGVSGEITEDHRYGESMFFDPKFLLVILCVPQGSV